MLGSSAVDLRLGPNPRRSGFVSGLGTAQRWRGLPRRRPQRFHATMSWKEEKKMLWTIAVVLIVLWLLGLVSSYTLGGAIHVLLVIAIAVFLIGIFQGRRTG
jgi:hypothetical protein